MRITFAIALTLGLLLSACTTPPDSTESTQARDAAVGAGLASTVSLVLDDGGRGDAFGSAIVLNDQGYLITAQHVIDGASGITVLGPNGHASLARVVAEDAVGDFAILQCKPLASMKPAQPAVTARVGEEVLSVGNPFGTSRLGGSPSVNAGIVSAIGRSFVSEKSGRIYLDCVQHDAPTNPGNSGGGVYNARGELIGMNVLINTPQDVAAESGVAFALPAARLRKAAEQLMRGESVKHGWLGARGYRTALWLTAEGLGRTGSMLREIEDGTPAYQAGVQAGDVIVRASWSTGAWPPSQGEPREWLFVEDELPPGQPMTLTISRAGRELEFKLTTAQRTLRQ
jgi:S1-C subfamily serine protease